MLLGEDFSWGHDCSGFAAGDCDGHCKGGDDCFTTADIALQEAVHRMGFGEVIEDFTGGKFLAICELEGERFEEGGEGGCFGERRGGLGGGARFERAEGELEEEEFLEHETAAGYGEGFEI